MAEYSDVKRMLEAGAPEELAELYVQIAHLISGGINNASAHVWIEVTRRSPTAQNVTQLSAEECQEATKLIAGAARAAAGTAFQDAAKGVQTRSEMLPDIPPSLPEEIFQASEIFDKYFSAVKMEMNRLHAQQEQKAKDEVDNIVHGLFGREPGKPDPEVH